MFFFKAFALIGRSFEHIYTRSKEFKAFCCQNYISLNLFFKASLFMFAETSWENFCIGSKIVIKFYWLKTNFNHYNFEKKTNNELKCSHPSFLLSSSQTLFKEVSNDQKKFKCSKTFKWKSKLCSNKINDKHISQWFLIRIKLSGNAAFDVSYQLRSLEKSINNNDKKRIYVIHVWLGLEFPVYWPAWEFERTSKLSSLYSNSVSLFNICTTFKKFE